MSTTRKSTGTRPSALPELAPAGVEPDDRIVVIDASDQTQSASGSEKLVSIKSLMRLPADAGAPSGIGSFTVPVLNLGDRHVAAVNLGAIGNPKAGLLAFYWGNTTNRAIKEGGPVSPSNNGLIRVAGEYRGMLARLPLGLILATGEFFHTADQGGASRAAGIIHVEEDYTRARRFVVVSPSEHRGPSPYTRVDAHANANEDVLLTYAQLNGILFGHYGPTASKGVLEYSQRVEMESAWLEQSGGDTLVKIALKNQDAAATGSQTFKVALFA